MLRHVSNHAVGRGQYDRSDSDVTLFFSLLLYGEYLLKLIANGQFSDTNYEVLSYASNERRRVPSTPLPAPSDGFAT